MKEAAIKKQLEELNAELTGLRFGGTNEAEGTAPQLVHAANDATLADVLAQVRMKLKYLLFDLEATRRENHYLRQMLEIHRNGRRNRPRPDNDWESEDGGYR